MTTVLQGLRLISDDKILKPADYLYDGQWVRKFSPSVDEKSETVIDCKGLLGSKGWIDLKCFAGEPGLESRETLESLGEGLKASGFCQAVLLPNTNPAVQSINEVAFIQQKTRSLFSTFHIQAAVTKDIQGDDFTEMLDLYHQGVRVFGEGLLPLSHGDRMVKVQQYIQRFRGILFDHSYDPFLALYGQMHEGHTSTLLGLKGIPQVAEEIAIQKNLSILEYTGGRLHLQTLSSAKSVELVRTAKAKGLQVTADVSIYQLLFTDEDLMDFDTSLKVMPPFRSEEDRLELLEGLRDGTIDALVSNHVPQDFDSKHMEFDLAPFGMAGLQTFLPALVKLEPVLGWPLLIQKITAGPEKILGIADGRMDSLTLFDPSATWTYNAKTNVSLSQNSPWFGQELTGRVKHVIHRGKLETIYE